MSSKTTVHIRCQEDVPDTWAPNTEYVMHGSFTLPSFPGDLTLTSKVSAQDELPPGCSRRHMDTWVYDADGQRFSLDDAWRRWSEKSRITREEYATMRAAVRFREAVEKLLEDEGTGSMVWTDALQDMLDAAKGERNENLYMANCKGSTHINREVE